MADKYQVELFYGYEDHEQGIFHAFDAVMPMANVDDDAIAAKLAEQLDCTVEDDRFNWDSMYIQLPEELVAQIKADAVKAYKEQVSSVKELNEDGYPREFVDNTFGQILEQEVASCLGCGLESKGFNVTDAEVATIVEKMKATPQAFLDRDFIESFCADTLYALRGLDPDKIRAMQMEINQLFRELEGAEIYDPGAADNIARVLSAKADELEAYVTGKSVADVLSGATVRSAETGRVDVVRDDFVKE